MIALFLVFSAAVLVDAAPEVQDAGPMPEMNARGQGASNGMSAPDNGPMEMTPGMMAMGSMVVVSVGSSRAEPGLLMRVLVGGKENLGAGSGLGGSRLTFSGWVDMSLTGSAAASSNLPLGFNYRANAFLLQQNWIRVDYAVNETGPAPSLGFRSDWILPGSDYRFTLPRGLLNQQLTADKGSPNPYGIDPIHFYGELYLPGVADGVDVKVGRFCMLHGIDMNEATMNLLASHSYTYLADPFTHTGVLTATRLTSQITFMAALTTGSEVFLDSAAEPTFVGGIRWMDNSTRTSLQLVTVLGLTTSTAREPGSRCCIRLARRASTTARPSGLPCDPNCVSTTARAAPSKGGPNCSPEIWMSSSAGSAGPESAGPQQWESPWLT
jgi:hypothetical protein